MAINNRRLHNEDKKFTPLDVVVGILEFLLSGEAFRLYLALIMGAMATATLYMGLGQTIGMFDTEYAQHLQLVICPIIFVATGWITMWLTEPRVKVNKRKLTAKEKRAQLNSWR